MDKQDNKERYREEFTKLLKASKLGKSDAAAVLGVGRQTIYNWLKGDVPIPESKIEFVREMLSKPSGTLKEIAKGGEGFSVESVLPYVVKNFDQFMVHEDFHRKVYIKAYDIANDIIEGKKLGKS